MFALCLTLFALGIGFVAGAPLVEGIKVLFDFMSQFFIANLSDITIISNTVAGLMATGSMILFTALTLGTVNVVLSVKEDSKPDISMDNPSSPQQVATTQPISKLPSSPIVQQVPNPSQKLSDEQVEDVSFRKTNE